MQCEIPSSAGPYRRESHDSHLMLDEYRIGAARGLVWGLEILTSGIFECKSNGTGVSVKT